MGLSRLVSVALALVPAIGCSYDSPGPSPDDPPTVGFEFDKSGADEESGTVMLPVVLSKSSTETITVTYTVLSGGTATPAEDFVVAATTLTFAPGETRAEIPVEIKSDTDETESDETIDIGLAMADGAELDPTRAIHEVKIADHILPRINFATASVDTQTSEDTPTVLSLTLTKPSEGESTVVMGVSGGATDPVDTEDITLTEGTVVTIPDGAISVDVPIGDVDDAFDEPDNEHAVFEIKGASQNLVLGATKIANHTITDNDATPSLQFKVASSSINENGTSITIEVDLSAESARPITIDLASDNTSTADANDFTLSATSLTFNPHTTSATGDTVKTFDVTINNDNIDEDAETVVLDLLNPTNATVGATSQHTLTINADAADAASLQFTNTAVTVDEDLVTNVDVEVSLSNPSAKTVTVDFAIDAASTATNGDDYDLTAGTVTFAPGDTKKNIAVKINRSSPSNEPDETVILNLSNVGNAALGTNQQFTLTIIE